MTHRINHRTSRLLAAAAGLAGLLAAGPSFAAVSILNTVPMSGGTVLTVPHAITLEFTGDVVPGSVSLEVHDPAGKPVTLGPVTAGKGKNAVTAPITQALPAGTFDIAWRVTAVDKAVSSGTFSFTYKP